MARVGRQAEPRRGEGTSHASARTAQPQRSYGRVRCVRPSSIPTARENQRKAKSGRSKFQRNHKEEMYRWQSAEDVGCSKDSCPVPKISALQKLSPVRKPSAFNSPGSAAVIISTSM